jgi:dTMP kinase
MVLYERTHGWWVEVNIMSNTQFPNNAKLFVIDGGEGAGKTTLIKGLKETFPSFIFTREPGGTPFAEQKRAKIFATPHASAREHFDLFWEAREDHMQNLILPSLRAGISVVSDRGDLSTFAYQLRGQAQTTELDELFWARRKEIVTSVIGSNNIHYVYLDIKPELGLARVRARAGEITHFDELGLDFHKRVRAGGLEFLELLDSLDEPYSISIADATLEPGLVCNIVAETIGR